MSKRLLVVGANSFAASAFARLGSESGYQLCGVYREQTDRIEEIRYEQLVPVSQACSLSDIDAVVFFASFIPYGRMNEPDVRLDEVNELLETVARQYCAARFVYCSSVSVYGVPFSLPLNETSPVRSPSAYGLGKLAGETIVGQCENAISVRIGSIYGPGMRSGTLLETWCRNAKESGKIAVFGDGSRQQDYIHVEDVAACLLAAVESDWRGPALCVSGKPVTNLELADMIKGQLAGTAIEIEGTDGSPSLAFDNALTMEELDWEPEVLVEDGIRELIDSL